MAKKFKDFIAHEPVHHKTSIGRHPSLCKMNKRKRKILKNIAAKENNENNVINVYMLWSSTKLYTTYNFTTNLQR